MRTMLVMTLVFEVWTAYFFLLPLYRIPPTVTAADPSYPLLWPTLMLGYFIGAAFAWRFKS